MQNRLRRYNVTRWAGDFLSALAGARDMQDRIEAKLLPFDERNEIIDGYKVSRRRALFLDYDGTLSPLVRFPFMARPDEKNDHVARLPRG